MAPRTEKQYEEIREQKRDLIMDTALHLFATEGYYNTSINKITKKAGISKGLIYTYFKSKEELIKEILHKASDDLFESFDPNNDGILTKDEFIFFVEENFRVIKENPLFWRLYTALMLQPNVIEIALQDFSKHGEGIIKMMFDFFKKQGAKDPEGEILLFSSIIKGATIQYIASPETFPLEALKNKIINHYKETCHWL